MKAIRTLFGTMAVVLGLGGLSAPETAFAADDPVVIRYSNWLAATYPLHARAMVPWMEDIEKATEGRVKFSVTPKVVGTVAGQYDVVAEGLADVVLFLPGYTPGRFTLMEGLDLPLFGHDTRTRCPATWRAYEKFIAPQNEFHEVVPLSVYCSTSGQIGTSGAEITVVDDFKGKKIRSSSEAITHALSLLDAVPISKPASEVFEMLSSRAIDGVVFPLDSMVGFKLDGAIKEVTYFDGGFSSSMVLIAMNPDTWAQISETDQKIIMELSGEALATRVGNMLHESEREAREHLVSKGVTITDASPELVEQVRQTVAPVREDWVARAKAAGMADPEEFLDYLSAEIAKPPPSS